MPLSESRIKEIYNRYKQHFIEMEHYDETREKLWQRKRLDINIKQRLIKKLKSLSIKDNKPVSRIIEDALNEYLSFH